MSFKSISQAHRYQLGTFCEADELRRKKTNFEQTPWITGVYWSTRRRLQEKIADLRQNLQRLSISKQLIVIVLSEVNLVPMGCWTLVSGANHRVNPLSAKVFWA